MLEDNVEVVQCEKNDKSIIENLSQFYLYDLSQRSKYADIRIAKDGSFEKMPFVEVYWEKESHIPFLIKQAEFPIGFALVNNNTFNSNADWRLAEFFILPSFRQKGIGRRVVKYILKQFPGLWEVATFKDNKISREFWRNVLPSSAPERYYDQHPQYVVYETKVK